jgi:hypothetical protein
MTIFGVDGPASEVIERGLSPKTTRYGIRTGRSNDAARPELPVLRQCDTKSCRSKPVDVEQSGLRARSHSRGPINYDAYVLLASVKGAL